MLTMGVIHVFRMPAFFVLVGFFMALLWEQRGAKATIKNRVERIVLPFLVFVPIIDQILSETSGLVLLDRPILFTHHLWFLYYLSWMIPIVAFAVILSQRLGLSLLPSSRWFKATFESTPRCIFMFTLLSFVPMFLMHWYEVPVDPSWTVNPYKLLFYLLFVASGWGIYKAKVDFAAVKPNAGRLVFLGLFSFVVSGVVRFGLAGEALKVPPPTTTEDHIAWCIMLLAHGLTFACLMRGLMGLFLRWVPSRSEGWRYASDAAYWVYIIHLMICFWLPMLWFGSAIPAFFLYLANIGITTLVCFTTYELLVRSTLLGRFLNGRRYDSAGTKWRLGSVILSVVTVGLSLQFTSVSNSANAHEQRIEQAKWDAWEDRGGPASVLPFFEEMNEVVPRLGGESRGPVCMPSGRYAVCHHPRTLLDARRGCTSVGGTLALPKSQAEIVELRDIRLNFGVGQWYWIDLDEQATEGRWVTSAGQAPTFTHWRPGQPDNNQRDEDCVAAFPVDEDAWHDVPCDNSAPFICEFSTKPSRQNLASLEDVTGAPAGFAGVWRLTSASLRDYSALQSAPLDEHRPTLAFVDALQLALSFEAEAVVIHFVLFNESQGIKIPFEISNQTEDRLTLAWGEDERHKMVISRRGHLLELDDGTRTTQLAQQD
ncbi:MAG: acyltransferase family protein [Myxococcota bacterium]|nr:acyltransferase family protein [Myxococcota bacterium]